MFNSDDALPGAVSASVASNSQELRGAYECMAAIIGCVSQPMPLGTFHAQRLTSRYRGPGLYPLLILRRASASMSSTACSREVAGQT